MSDGSDTSAPGLQELAADLGIQRVWRDVKGVVNTISDSSMKAVARALGFPASSTAEINDSRARIAAERMSPPKLITTEVGKPTHLPSSIQRALLTDEDGERTVVFVNGHIPPIAVAGYYDLEIGGHHVTLAVAPAAFEANLKLQHRRIWGPSVQIPALRGRHPSSYGNLGDLHDCIGYFSAHGADAVLISPIHSLFSKDGKGFSPYSPSSRLFLNSLMGDPSLLGMGELSHHSEPSALINWERALPQRHIELRAVYEATKEKWPNLAAAPDDQGLAHRHAVFEVLDEHFRRQGLVGWKNWPAAFHDPHSPGVASFAKQHSPEIDFHLFLQGLARESLRSSQNHARKGGMDIGILSDLAVGVHPQGADTWMLRGQMLDGLTIGAPPDPLGPLGQNWMLTTFSPRGLRDSGFSGYIQMLRSGFQGAGGMRIDHAFGLARLWVIPNGAESSDGAYLTYPFSDLIRIAALEASMVGAIVVGEDLGTKPMDFSQAVANQGLMGMRVMWFERAADDGFVGPDHYDRLSLATTSTHDTATVAGWWSGADLELADDLQRFPNGISREAEEDRRAWDRGMLWATLGQPDPRPSPDDTEVVVDAALDHMARSNAALVILPFEDLAGLREQTNVPGTIDEHPNWRRRYPSTTKAMLDGAKMTERIGRIVALRHDAKERG